VRGIAVVALMQMVRAKPVARRLLGHGAPAGTFGCLVRNVHYWAGPRQGQTETLQGGEWELDVITDQNLLWERENGESLHDGLPLDIIYRPNGVDQLIAHNADLSFMMRIALGRYPQTVPTPFSALGTHVALSGICFFEPRDL
jgi:hypothetical protein